MEKKANISADSTNKEAAIKNGKRKGRYKSDAMLSNYLSEDWGYSNEGSNIIWVGEVTTKNRTNKSKV